MRSVITGSFLSFLFFALPASAEPTFPGAIQEAANIPCTPTCLLCHTTVPGQKDNFTQPFAGAVLANGLLPEKNMVTVVANLRAKMVDTDGDGKLDVDELAAGSDPNKADPHAELCGALYGCGAHVAAAPLPPPKTSHWWFTVPVLLGLWVTMRRQAVRGSGNR